MMNTSMTTTAIYQILSLEHIMGLKVLDIVVIIFIYRLVATLLFLNQMMLAIEETKDWNVCADVKKTMVHSKHFMLETY